MVNLQRGEAVVKHEGLATCPVCDVSGWTFAKASVPMSALIGEPLEKSLGRQKT